MGMFMDGIEKIEFQEGHVFFTEGDMNFFFFVLDEGKVEIYRETLKGNQHLDTVTEGQAFGEFALVSRQPRSATAKALTKGSAYKVSEENYKKLLEDLPGWAVSVIQGLVTRLKKTNEALAQHSF